MSKNALSFFKLSLSQAIPHFPIVRIPQITRKLMHNNDVFVHARS
jgi:hypothetical protein